jgi:hypothetical protein
VAHVSARYAEAARRIGFAIAADDDTVAGAKLADGLMLLNAELGVPTKDEIVASGRPTSRAILAQMESHGNSI